MINDNIRQRITILFVSLIFLVLLTFSTVMIAKKFLEKDKTTIILKHINQSFKQKIHKEFRDEPLNLTYYHLPDSYRNSFSGVEDFNHSYSLFLQKRNVLKKSFASLIDQIENNLNKEKLIPVLEDRNSSFVFYPLNYLNLSKINDIENINVFSYSNQMGRKKSFSAKYNVLNYSYISIDSDKFVLILYSLPKDPDPLYPENKRQLILISGTKGSNHSYYSDYFILNN